MVYACSCSRKKIHTESPDGIYSGTCRNKDLSLDAVENGWRLKIPSGPPIEFCDEYRQEKVIVDLAKEMGDFVIRRKGGAPAYQIASIADDVFYKINLIIRGEDLITSTAAQLKLAKVLKLDFFSGIRWQHLPLLVDSKGEKLSKSRGDTSIQWLIEQGASRHDILTNIGLNVFGREITVSSLWEMLEIYQSLKIVKGS
jgi:glutamyl-tRNA synthetase